MDHEEDRIDIARWKQQAQWVGGDGLEKVRRVQKWNENEWKPFPDVGLWQPTRLTGDITSGAASAIWLCLYPGEAFNPHRHPGAIHSMWVYEGEGICYWQDERGVWSAVMRTGDQPFVILPGEEHAISAGDRRVVILVVNMPADNLHKHDYALPVVPHKH